jgi:hypothetical protein
MRRVLMGLVVLGATLMVSPLAQAQQAHVTDRNTLDQLVAWQVNQDRADRQLIADVLKRPQVRAVAHDAGLDIARAEAAVATLSGPELKEAARHAREVDDRLAGGGNVTISTTTIIIALLVVILIIVAVD